MNIVFSSDNATFSLMIVSIYSLAVNNQKHQLKFFILEDGIPLPRKRHLEALATLYPNVSVKFFTIDSGLFIDQHINSRVSLQSYYRYLTPNILELENRALYLDVDTLCLDDISELYSVNMGTKCIAGAIDTELYKRPNNLAIALGFDKKHTPYLNSGVLLMNLEEMRRMSIVEAFMDNLNNRHNLIPEKYDIFNDQTIMNLTFRGHLKLVETKYNTLIASLVGSKYPQDPAIVHFSGRHKPLTYYDDETKPYMEIYYRMVRELEALLDMDILHDIVVSAGARTTSYLK